jgi:hypothetical protein
VSLAYRHPFAASLGAAVLCAVVALPFGDASGGWNLISAPLVAAGLGALLVRHRRTKWALTAAGLTLLLMLCVLVVIVAFWGI